MVEVEVKVNWEVHAVVQLIRESKLGLSVKHAHFCFGGNSKPEDTKKHESFFYRRKRSSKEGKRTRFQCYSTSIKYSWYFFNSFRTVVFHIQNVSATMIIHTIFYIKTSNYWAEAECS